MKMGLLPLLRRHAILATSLLVWGCGSSTEVPDDEATRGPEWNESSHGRIEPDTSQAFPATRRTMTIAIPEASWNAIKANLAEACAGATSCTGSSLDAFPKVSNWYMADLHIDGKKWASVGLRLPSNGDVADAWKAGHDRYPFRITMDKWEKEVPTIDNQRFYGFQKLSLQNLENDSSGIKHQVAGAIYRSQGVPAYRSALVVLNLAKGKDTLRLGLYSLREMLDGPMLRRWFSGNGGNLYEPRSTLAAFVPAEFSDGENDGTYADVKAFIAALNATNRTTDRAFWRSTLGANFDVDGFLSWLAVSTVLGEKGNYGDDARNYALYADGGKLRWMSLHVDDVFPTGNGLTRGIRHVGAAGTWPLIANLLADSVHCESYKAKVASLVAPTGPLSATNLLARVEAVASTALSGLDDAATRPAKLRTFAERRPAIVNDSIANFACPNGN
jgi:spore coat protein H